MSGLERRVARNLEAPRKTRRGQKLRSYFNANTNKIEERPSAFHHAGDMWWRLRFADLVERRRVTAGKHGHSKITYEPRPKRAAKSGV